MSTRFCQLIPLAAVFTLLWPAAADDLASSDRSPRHWIWSTAYAVPGDIASDEAEDVSIVEGSNHLIYVGIANAGDNARRMEFDPATRSMQIVDGEQIPAADQNGHATQPKFRTRNNGLFACEPAGDGSTPAEEFIGPLIPNATDVRGRAISVDPDGRVWAGVMATLPGQPRLPRLVSYAPGDAAPVDHGPIAIGNRDDTDFQRGTVSMITGICAAFDGTIYLTTSSPLTLHAVKIPKIAGVTTAYRHNSHADVIFTRLLETDTLDGNGQNSPLKLISLYVDQVGEKDLSRPFARKHSFATAETVTDALMDGTDQLAVDGVIVVAEHGNYPRSDTGQTVYPKRRFFTEVVDVFRRTGKVVPVFSDKHLSDNWQDAKWIYDTAQELQIPLMAGSSLPVLWRYPAEDVRKEASLEEIVALSYGSLDAYGFHALEMVQSLAERRRGGETGVDSVQCLAGDEVWEAVRRGVPDRELLNAAFARLSNRPPLEIADVEQASHNPVLFLINYRDGLRAGVLMPGAKVGEWSVAWRYADDDPRQSGATASTRFSTQNVRPFMHFAHLNAGIEKMMQTGRPTWPVERTLLTSGLLDALLISKRDGGKTLRTPWLDVTYTNDDWAWRQPPPPTVTDTEGAARPDLKKIR